MRNYDWAATFSELFDRCVERYRSGDQDFTSYYTDADLAFLDSIGYKQRELFDFVEDWCDYGDPSPATAVLIANVRRDYLRLEMKGEKSDHYIPNDDLPPRAEELGGIPWLPRILTKARAKLRGELDPDTMYCCGGDRNFLQKFDIAPADFLIAVWEAGDDDQKVLQFVQAQNSA